MTSPSQSLLLPRTLGGRIALGFGIVLMLHTTMAVVGHLGIQQSGEDLQTLDAERRVTDFLTDIESELKELQEAALIFSFTGNETGRRRFDELQAELKSHLSAAEDLQLTPGELSQIYQLLLLYREHFDTAYEDRAKLRIIVDEIVSRAGKNLSATIAELAEVGEDGAGPLAAEVVHLQREVSQAQSEVFDYIYHLEYEKVERALTRLDECEVTVERMGAVGDSTLLKHALEELGYYRSLVNRLVVHMRGYLHLVNVVIAGNSAGFIRVTKQIRKRYSQRLNDAYVASVDSQSRFETLNVLVAVGTILAGLSAGWLITRTVRRPLHDMAGTFDLLAMGETTVEVPGRQRDDEIGRMARAAEAFRLKNVHTIELLEDAKRSNQDLEQFAYVASHDLQEPLRMVASYVQLLERKYVKELDERAKEYIGYAVDGTVRMKKLINDLLTYSRVGQAKGTFEPIILDEVVDDLESSFALRISERGVRVRRRGTSESFVADRSQVLQVMHNLFSNAIKFCDQAEPTVTVECEVGDSGERTLRVADNGIGISPEHADRVFEIFQRLHPREAYEGTGIGLAICRRLVQGWGGQIWFDSGPGGGTVFSFTLPIESEGAHSSALASTAGLL